MGDLYAYAARVAGTVGAMMAVLMGQRSADVVARACDLGVAMQLSNIARDVGEDARAGRIYLPLDWLWEAGIDPDAWLKEPVFTEALGSVVMRLLEAADVLYRRADDGIANLPADCRPGISAARHLYAGIGHQVAARGAIRSRVVPWCRHRARPACLGGRFLLRLLTGTHAPITHRWKRHVPGRSGGIGRCGGGVAEPSDQVIWLIMLFERLERGQRAALERHG